MKYSDEAQLVAEAQKGNQIAFAELAYRYRTAAYAAAYIRLRDHHDAEDVAQDALLTAYEKISNLVDPRKFRAWLCAIAARKATRRRTQKEKEAQHLQVAAERSMMKSEPDIWEALAEGELHEALHILILELSQVHREAIELYYLQGYSIAEIAKFLDVPIGTVKRRLFDARQKLKAQLCEIYDSELP
ncbi:MAG: RNA polymerase sigma factor [Candidatus Poribacteria bacterium]